MTSLPVPARAGPPEHKTRPRAAFAFKPVTRAWCADCGEELVKVRETYRAHDETAPSGTVMTTYPIVCAHWRHRPVKSGR